MSTITQKLSHIFKIQTDQMIFLTFSLVYLKLFIMTIEQIALLVLIYLSFLPLWNRSHNI